MFDDRLRSEFAMILMANDFFFPWIFQDFYPNLVTAYSIDRLYVLLVLQKKAF